MAKGILSDDPSRADFRYIKYMLSLVGRKKSFQSDPKLYERVSKTFQKAGGSWEALFKGSIKDVLLLKRVLKVAIKGKVLRKEPELG